MDNINVLIVEDDPNLGQILSEYLQIKGLNTTLSKDGEEGLQMYNRGGFDLCILDIMIESENRLPGIGHFLRTYGSEFLHHRTGVVVSQNMLGPNRNEVSALDQLSVIQSYGKSLNNFFNKILSHCFNISTDRNFVIGINIKN